MIADRFYGLDRGDQENDVSEGTSTPTKAIEVAVELALNLEKSEVVQKLEEIKNHIVKGDWPPA